MNRSDGQRSPNDVTCHCQHCDGGIEFDASDLEEGESRSVECPHCHLETILLIPRQDTVPPVILPTKTTNESVPPISYIQFKCEICGEIITANNVSPGEPIGCPHCKCAQRIPLAKAEFIEGAKKQTDLDIASSRHGDADETSGCLQKTARLGNAEGAQKQSAELVPKVTEERLKAGDPVEHLGGKHVNIDDFGFRFDISSVEEAKLDNGEDAYAFFLTISNVRAKARMISLSKATYLAKSGEQLEQDLWLSGYLIENGRILGNAHRKSGLLFYKKHLACISDGDYLYIDANIPDVAKKLSLRFNRLKNTAQDRPCWIISEMHAEEMEVVLSPRSLSKMLSKKIERLEALEDRFGIRLEGLSVKVASSDSDFLEINGELHLRDGVQLNQSIISDILALILSAKRSQVT